MSCFEINVGRPAQLLCATRKAALACQRLVGVFFFLLDTSLVSAIRYINGFTVLSAQNNSREVDQVVQVVGQLV
jgi:hypothetical protein